MRPALTAAAKAASDLLVVIDRPKPRERTADEIEADRRAEEVRRREADELAEQQRELAKEQARLRQQEEELERRRRQADQERERLRQEAERERDRRRREAEVRAAQTHSVEVERAVQVQDLARALVDQLTHPVKGKKLRVEWRWE